MRGQRRRVSIRAGQGLQRGSVRVSYPGPAHASAYSMLFHCPVHFDQARQRTGAAPVRVGAVQTVPTIRFCSQVPLVFRMLGVPPLPSQAFGPALPG